MRYVFRLHGLPVLVVSSNTPGASICLFFICMAIGSDLFSPFLASIL